MPLAIAKPVREELVRRRLQGESLTAIAADLSLKYRTVRGLWQRYRRQGEQALEPDYGRCGRRGPRFAPPLCEAALALRREHPRWGAGLICLQLREQFPDQEMPSERTVNRWLRQAGLQPLRGKRPQTAQCRRGQKPHEVWQMDAKECIRLGDGQVCSQLSVVDEASGAAVGAIAFPPAVLEPGGPAGCPGSSAGSVWPLGAARADASG